MSRRRKVLGESTTEVPDQNFDSMVPDWETFNIPLWLTDNDLPPTPVDKKTFTWTIACPWCSTQATAHQTKGGALKFKCGHPDCLHRDAKDLADKFPPNIATHFTKWYKKEPDQIAPQDPNYKPPVQIKALGRGGDGLCWYQCSTTGHVTGLKPESHVEGSLYGITPYYKYWLWRFGRGETGKIDWKWAARTMIEECDEMGIYDPMKTRGTGVYFDRGRLVINAGNELIVDGKPEGIFNFKGEFLYESRSTIQRITNATDSDLSLIHSITKRLPFVDAGGADIFIGMIICGYLSGVIDWRPHAWLIGAKGSGKSKAMQLIANALTHTTGGRYHKGRTTAPGIMQGLHNSATIICLDEQGEVNNIQQNERIQAIIQMARNSSTDDNATEAKGGAYGKGSEYLSKCCFMFASIFHSIDQPQDKDRFSFIKFAESPASKENWPGLQKDLLATFTPEFASSVFWRVATDARSVLDVIKSFVETLARVPANRRRDCDQWGTILGAAWWVTHPGQTPSESEIIKMYGDSRTNDISEDDSVNFGETAIKSFLGFVPPMERSSIGEHIHTCAIGGWRDPRSREYKAAAASGDEMSEAFLQRFGVRVENEKDGLLVIKVCINNQKVKEIMTRIGFPNYTAVLLTYPGAQRVNKVTDFGKVKYASYVSIPIEGLIHREPLGENGLPRHREIRPEDAEQREPWSERAR